LGYFNDTGRFEFHLRGWCAQPVSGFPNRFFLVPLLPGKYNNDLQQAYSAFFPRVHFALDEELLETLDIVRQKVGIYPNRACVFDRANVTVRTKENEIIVSCGLPTSFMRRESQGQGRGEEWVDKRVEITKRYPIISLIGINRDCIDFSLATSGDNGKHVRRERGICVPIGSPLARVYATACCEIDTECPSIKTEFIGTSDVAGVIEATVQMDRPIDIIATVVRRTNVTASGKAQYAIVALAIDCNRKELEAPSYQEAISAAPPISPTGGTETSVSPALCTIINPSTGAHCPHSALSGKIYCKGHSRLLANSF